MHSTSLVTEASGVGLSVGTIAPSLELDNVSGKRESLQNLCAKGPTFLVFYRGGWCPFCNAQLRDLVASNAELELAGARVVAISVDSPTNEAKTQAEHGVPFPMLSDPDLRAHQAFKVVHETGTEERAALAGFGVDLAQHSGRGHQSFAVPAIFLVDREGVIRFAHVSEDFKIRPSARQLIDVAMALRRSTSTP